MRKANFCCFFLESHPAFALEDRLARGRSDRRPWESNCQDNCLILLFLSSRDAAREPEKTEETWTELEWSRAGWATSIPASHPHGGGGLTRRVCPGPESRRDQLGHPRIIQTQAWPGMKQGQQVPAPGPGVGLGLLEGCVVLTRRTRMPPCSDRSMDRYRDARPWESKQPWGTDPWGLEGAARPSGLQ